MPADRQRRLMSISRQSTGVDGWRQVELQRRAAEQFLIGGHIDRGMDVIRTVLRSLRMRLAPSPLLALASLAGRRARIRRRGLAFVARDPNQIPADRLLRIDTCWSVTTGLAMVDNIRAADFNTRHLLLALDTGEPYRVSASPRTRGRIPDQWRHRRRDGRRVRGSSRLSRDESGSPHAAALSALTAGMSAFLVGEWRKASRLCERALDGLREVPRCGLGEKLRREFPTVRCSSFRDRLARSRDGCRGC